MAFYPTIHQQLLITIMCRNKLYSIVVSVIFLFTTSDLVAQKIDAKTPRPKRKYALVLYAGGGVAQYVANIRTASLGLNANTNRTSPAGTLRIMWHPNHRLRMGLETGWTQFFSYTVNSDSVRGKVALSAIPIMAMASMPIVKRVNLFAGLGSYFLTTRLQYKGDVESTVLSLGSTFAINYSFPVTKKLNLAAELKWMDAFQTKDDVLSLQAQLVWRFLEY